MVEATEGQLVTAAGEAAGESGKNTQAAWQEIFAAISESLRKVTLAEIVRDEAEVMWHI